MQKFNSLKSIPAYLSIVNIDTDMIIPKQFLKTIKRTGLGKNLFFEMRYDDQGNEIKDFILNQKPFNESKILIAGKNFGCGSSREHAPWALLDFGITCVISSSYADIFYNNCFKNGILPIKIDEEKIKQISEYSLRKEEIKVDLNEQKIIFGNNEIDFNLDTFKKKCLIEGLDDIALSLEKSEKIVSFEKKTVSILNSILKVFLGDKSGKDLKKITPLVDKINDYYISLEKMSNDSLRDKTNSFKKKIFDNTSKTRNNIDELNKKIINESSFIEKEKLFQEVETLELELKNIKRNTM